MTPDPGPRHLILLRHAKAEHPERMEDIQRPLSLVGRRQSARGRCRARRRRPGARPRALLVERAHPPDVGARSVDPRRDAGGRGSSRASTTPAPATLLELVQAVPDDVRTLLVVGHEPTMSHLAGRPGGPGLRPDDPRAGPGGRADRQLVAARRSTTPGRELTPGRRDAAAARRSPSDDPAWRAVRR